MKRFLTIPSHFYYLRLVKIFVDDLLLPCQLDLRIYYAIYTCILESVNNSIKHGNRNDIRKFVEISAEFFEHFLIVEVSDEGEGFDFSAVPDPTVENRLLKEGGRGIFLIKKLTDQVVFKKSGSVIQLKFKLDCGNQFLF